MKYQGYVCDYGFNVSRSKMVGEDTHYLTVHFNGSRIIDNAPFDSDEAIDDYCVAMGYLVHRDVAARSKQAWDNRPQPTATGKWV